jgi:hypothetical protein
MAMYWREKVLLAGIEATYGAATNLTGSANAIYATEIGIQPMQGQNIDRGHETPYLGNAGTIPADLHTVLTCSVELVGSGTAGTPPAWGPLMRACGCAEVITPGTSVVYSPVTRDHESVKMVLNIGGVAYSLRGTRGAAVINVNASDIPRIAFTFTGLWTPPADTALATPDYSAFNAPLVASDANTPVATIDGEDFVTRTFSLDLGNQVEGRFLIRDEQIVIVDKAERLAMQVEATPLATFDPYAAAASGAAVPFVVRHGTQAGRIATITVPRAQIERPDSPTEAQGIVEWPLRAAPLPVSGNDQWTLTLT